jgi:phage-related protein
MARKPVVWLGDTLATVRAFPPLARRRVGHELGRVQTGAAPADMKAMPSIGLGVNEIRVRAEAIYVLHAFEKKSRSTARLDAQLARQRYRNLLRERS